MANREIKFRVWDVTEKVWSTGFLVDICKAFPNNQIVSISQFTGKHDQDGKEIWEGDIIDFDIQEWGGRDNIHVVTWNEKSAEWSWGGGITSDMEFRKVIGNIYENPELIPKG
jgi:hypothetical protein